MQISKIAAAYPDSIILREKDLSENDYTVLAEKIMSVCMRYSVPFTMHYYYKAAIRLGVKRIHLPLPVLRSMTDEYKSFFDIIGVSCHSLSEAAESAQRGASYIIAGHIFETECKAGLKGRGIDFLREMKSAVSIPVYAIGGISEKNVADVITAGADGICIMSGFMKSGDPAKLISDLREITYVN